MPQHKEYVKQVTVGDLSIQDNDAINKAAFNLAMMKGGMITRKKAILIAMYIMAKDDPSETIARLKSEPWQNWDSILQINNQNIDDTDW